ncbi:MAG: hypothetical protein ACE5IL_02660 [Myxococcota bacterium]
MPRLCVALLGALGGILVATPATAQRSSILSRPQVTRIVDTLESDSERLRDEVALFLDRARRWPPVGADAELWNEVRALEDGADRIQSARILGASTGIERDVRSLLEHGAALERLLGPVRPGRTVQSAWQSVRGGLVSLARSFGYDYERDLVRATPRAGTAGDLGGGRRSADAPAARRYGPGDERTVAAALARIDDLASQLAAKLRYAGYSDSDSALQSLGESLLRGAARDAGVEDPRRAEVESTAESLRKAAREAATRFRRTPSVAGARTSAVSLLRLGSRLGDAMRLSPPGREGVRIWGDLRSELNRLARVYDLALLPSRP